MEVEPEASSVVEPARSTLPVGAEALPAYDTAEIQARIVELVSQKTGYPPEMLDLDLDLEADLGVDTVKQAELFAAVREMYAIPRREDLRLSDYNTLSKVVGFVSESLAGQRETTPLPLPPIGLRPNRKERDLEGENAADSTLFSSAPAQPAEPPRGVLFLSAQTAQELKEILLRAADDIQSGRLPASRIPGATELGQPQRLAVDYDTPADLTKKLEKALKMFDSDTPAARQALAAQGIFRGSGQPGKVAFLFPGQGSQYANMLAELRGLSPVVAETFREADEVMTPILGRPLTSLIFVPEDKESVARAEEALRDTAITQPAVLTADVAMLRLLATYGYQPDMVAGHSLGEYAALVAAGALSFAAALQIVSARGREMTRVSMDDNGAMAAVSAPIGEVERILQDVPGYVVIANINSPLQSVIGGATAAVDAALQAFQSAGFQAVRIPVSHAFHTKIVAPASGPLREVIARLGVSSPRIPVIANVTGQEYPRDPEAIMDMLATQVASPVQFIRSMQTIYAAGVRVLIESGPKRVLTALATDNLKDKEDVTILSTNHPRKGALPSLNEALCGLWAAGVIPFGAQAEQPAMDVAPAAIQLDISPAVVLDVAKVEAQLAPDASEIQARIVELVSQKTGYPAEMLDLDLDLEADLGVDTVKQAELFAAVREMYAIPRREDLRLSDYNTLSKVVGFVKENTAQLGEHRVEVDSSAPTISQDHLDDTPNTTPLPLPPNRKERDLEGERVAEIGLPSFAEVTDRPGAALESATATDTEASEHSEPVTRHTIEGSVVISGAGLGLPGVKHAVFDDDNIRRILSGENMIEPLAEATRAHMLDKRVTRLNKSDAGATMDVITDMERTIKLAGQRGAFDLHADFGVPADRVEATDIATQLAIAAGIEALRDAGVPLVMRYRRTSLGTLLPDRWMLPESLADETGVIFGSAFPGMGRMAEESERFYTHHNLTRQVETLRELQSLAGESSALRHELEARIAELERQLADLDYHFDRRFIFRILNMGHSQFAEYIGARGPNTGVNAACATTTHAVALAEDWIRTGRARRVVVIAGDDVTSGRLVEWIGTGLLASGATTTEGNLRLAALPFDRRRNGMIMGMGAAALVVEAEDAARERGVRAIAEILSAQVANSAFHGTRLDVCHVREVMDRLVTQAEQRFGLDRAQMAGKMVFLSHETYTPARGGSAAAEIHALRHTFKDSASRVIIANTKGFTGHTMGVGVEDVVAVKALETGIVPPIANLDGQFEPDPELGDLNLSRGGQHPVEYALRLGAGFGSQIAMTLLRKIPGVGERIDRPVYQRWLSAAAGYESAELEVANRTLRVVHQGAPTREPAKSTWQYGTGPTLRAAEPINEAIEAKPEPAAPEPVVVETAPVTAPTAVQVVERRVPAAVLAARLDLCKPTGVQLDAGARVVVVYDRGGAGDALAGLLRARGIQVLELKTENRDAGAQAQAWLAGGPVQGVYFLPALDASPALESITVDAWQSALEEGIYRLHALMHALTAAGGSPFLVSATRLGGLHAILPGVDVPAPLGGAVTGFTKAYAAERPRTLVKTVDFTREAAAGQIAARLMEETLRDPGMVEIGWEGQQRFTISLVSEPLADATIEHETDEPDVYLVTGGTGGIAAPILLDIARSKRGVFYLTGRSPLLAASDPELELLADRDALRRALAARLAEAGEKATPARIEARIAALERAAAANALLRDLRALGSSAVYAACDVTDAEAVERLVGRIQAAEGRLAVILHAAGVDHSKLLESKTPEDFARVFATKATGFINLVRAMRSLPRPPRAVVAFSSVAARFGNAGQTDYAAANDLLNKLCAALPASFPATRFLSVDWGAWAEVGMASRGSLPTIMERAGIEMLQPAVAAPLLRHELEAGTGGEVLLAGALGMLARPRDRDGGLDVEAANRALTEGSPAHVMLSRVTGLDLFRGIILEAELDPSSEPFLKDHAVNGIPVLPGVMGIEGFSVAAQHVASVLGASSAGFQVSKLEDIRFLAPFKFYRGEPRRITWHAQVVRVPGGLLADVSLQSTLALKARPAEVVRHFTGRVHLRPLSAPETRPARVEPPHWNGAYTLNREDVYKLYFHGPAFQVLDAVQRSGEYVLGRLRGDMPPTTSTGQPLITAPLLIELCLQTAGIYEIGATGVLALPQAIGEVRIYPQPQPAGDLYAQVTPGRDAENGLCFDARVTDGEGRLYLELKDYRTSPLPYPVAEELRRPLQKLVDG